MKAYFHCIGIMLVICQDVSAYYICYIDIYPRSYESLFSLDWHIIRNMSRRMYFLKISCKGSAKKKRIWLFGDQFEQFKGKNITKVVITISRQEGGQYASVNLNIKTHNYKSRPSGKPSYVGTVGTPELPLLKYTSCRLPSSASKNANT